MTRILELLDDDHILKLKAFQKDGEQANAFTKYLIFDQEQLQENLDTVTTTYNTIFKRVFEMLQNTLHTIRAQQLIELDDYSQQQQALYTTVASTMTHMDTVLQQIATVLTNLTRNSDLEYEVLTKLNTLL
jgi:hypothetical protein